MVVYLDMLYPTQLILHVLSLNLSLRHTAYFCAHLLMMEGTERVGLLLLSSETREDGMRCMIVARD
jgi:hypothetical protein